MFSDLLFLPLHSTLGFIIIYQSINLKFFELPQFLLFGYFFDFMLFFVFLYCIPIAFMVF